MNLAMEVAPAQHIEMVENARALLELSDVGKHFDNGTVALAGVTLSIARGAFISLLGASGCGKSTVLRLIAGLTQPTRGTISWPQAPSPRRRAALSYVFQEPTLMPWATALKNVMLPLALSGVTAKVAQTRAQEALELVGLSGCANSYPRELSGGMKMRVSLARAMVTRPEILLLDEPFAALDEITRAKLNSDLLQLWTERGFTAVFVTHSVFEAVYLSQRVVVFAARPGRVFADCPIAGESNRGEAFRTSVAYIEQCAGLSAKLKEAMA